MSEYLRSPGAGPLRCGRPLLASRPITMRGATSRRALFFLHPCRPLLIAAWHQGDSLDAAKAARLWAAHTWELSNPPGDVAGLLDAGLPLQTVTEALGRESKRG